MALLKVADEASASLALVGDRAQLPAVGRGGVLDIAAQLSRRTFDMATVHRFTDPVYPDLTTRMRRGENPALLFDRLHALGLVAVHPSDDDAHLAIARAARVGEHHRGRQDRAVEWPQGGRARPAQAAGRPEADP